MSVVTSTEKGFGVLNRLEKCRKGMETKKKNTNTSLGCFTVFFKNRCMYSDEFLQLGLNYILMIAFTKATNFSSEIVGGQLYAV